MTRSRRKAPTPPSADEHLLGLSDLLAQLKAHLTASAGKKGTYGDYLRLLEFYRGIEDAGARQILVGWIDSESSVADETDS